MDASENPINRLRKSHQYRSVHRSRQHETAHAEDSTGPAAMARHPLVCRDTAGLITTQSALADLVHHLHDSGVFAYDSEFIGELTYVPKLCLIQAATSKRVALIDPLVGLDLREFWELICDPAIEKIVHAGQQDIEPVFRHLHRAPCNLFDTQVAAGFAGMAYPVALSKLVHEMVGAKLGKGLTFTHWDQRPLSSSQLRYAADDVRYLPAVHAELGKRLNALGHASWAKEECAALCDPVLYRFDPDSHYLRIRGAITLSNQGLAILRALTIWRDAAARAHDLPLRGLLRDEVLLDLARSPVNSVDKLASVRGLPRPVEEAHGTEIVETIAKAIASPPVSLSQQRQADTSPVERFRADALWAAVQGLCAGQGIDPNLVVSRQDLGEFYRSFIALEPTDSHRLMTGWRRLAVGDRLVAFLKGMRGIELKWAEGSLRTP